MPGLFLCASFLYWVSDIIFSILLGLSCFHCLPFQVDFCRRVIFQTPNLSDYPAVHYLKPLYILFLLLEKLYLPSASVYTCSCYRSDPKELFSGFSDSLTRLGLVDVVVYSTTCSAFIAPVVCRYNLFVCLFPLMFIFSMKYKVFEEKDHISFFFLLEIITYRKYLIFLHRLDILVLG